jgi:hypothetical protein
VKYLNQYADSIYVNKSIFEIEKVINEVINKLDNNNEIEITNRQFTGYINR